MIGKCDYGFLKVARQVSFFVAFGEREFSEIANGSNYPFKIRGIRIFVKFALMVPAI